MEIVGLDSVGLSEEELVEEVYNDIVAENRRRLWEELHNESVIRLNQQLKKDQDMAWSKDRSMRHIATLPQDVVLAMRERFGPGVFKDKKLFKEALNKMKTGEQWLTVNKNTI